METIRQNKLGSNPIKTYKRLSKWGVEEMVDRQWPCLPKGKAHKKNLKLNPMDHYESMYSKKQKI